MFFGRKNKKIKKLQEDVKYFMDLSDKQSDELIRSYKSVNNYEGIICRQNSKIKALNDKYSKLLSQHNSLKKEVSRLSKAKNQLVKDKKTCQKTIKTMSKENKYYRDSKGRFAKRK